MVRLSLSALLSMALLATATARDVIVRAYLHDPVKPLAEPFTMRGAPGGASVALTWRAEGLSEPATVSLDGQNLLMFSKDNQLKAKATVPANLKELILVLTPGPGDNPSPPYRAVAIDGSAREFPWGTSLVISTLGVEAAVEAGEHRLRLPGGKITKIPAVTKRDEFNMAQVNFLMREGEALVPFTERRLQFVSDNRRIFLLHATPGSQQPFVTTLLDYQPQTEPGSRR